MAVADQVVKTTLVVNANATSLKSVGEALDELITKAKELNDLLAGIRVGGGEKGAAAGKGGKGGASGGVSWQQPQPGDEGEGGGGGGGGKRKRKRGASGGGTGDGEGGDEGGVPGGLGGGSEADKEKKKNNQRLGYATAVGVGMLARSIKSHSVAYHEGMYGSQVTEAAGAYSGDIFQQAAAYTQAQAQREQAELRHASPWAVANVLASGGGLLGSGLMMLPGTWTKVAGLGLQVLSTGVGAWAGRNIAAQGAEIGVEAAKKNAAINTAQRMQDMTMDLLKMQRNVIALGARDTSDFSSVINAGEARGYTAIETQDLTNRYLTAGGRMFKGGPNIDFLRYHTDFNISPETTGSFESAFHPGGGAIPGYTPPAASQPWWVQGTVLAGASVNNNLGRVATDAQNASINAARAAGVQPARMDEWVGRNASYLRAGAERNVNIAPFSFTDTMNYLPTSVQGFARAAGAENMRNTGMSMADELGNLMMPQELARGLMMANIVGKGGGPSDWQKQMTDPNAIAGNVSDIYAQLPDMLKPFFLQSTTGLIGVDNFGKDIGGTTSTDYPKDTASTEPSDIRKAMAVFAENQNRYILEINKVIDNLKKFSTAIDISIANIEKYGDLIHTIPM